MSHALLGLLLAASAAYAQPAAPEQAPPSVPLSTAAIPLPPAVPASSTPAPGAPAQPAPAAPPQFASMGQPLPLEKGPWVLGDVLLFSGASVSTDTSWRERVRGRVGTLYTRDDIAADVASLDGLGVFSKVEPFLFSMPAPVPAEFQTISASTSEVRLIYNLTLKPAPPPPPAKPAAATPPAAVSGIVLTPTAYRGAGRYTTPGLGLDFNAVYFIGRLYGHNSFENSVRKTNYIDRLGVWLLSAEGKMQVQSETRWRPALAVGGHGSLLFRDSPQPSINTPTVSVKVDQKTTKTLADAYIAASKNIYGARVTAGFMQGSTGDLAAQLTEYLAPQALEFYAGRKSDRAWSRSMPFASILLLPKPQYPLAVEVIRFNGASLSPVLVNFKLGYFLHLNFDVSYLKYRGGYEFLGTFQFRYNQFPRR